MESLTFAPTSPGIVSHKTLPLASKPVKQWTLETWNAPGISFLRDSEVEAWAQAEEHLVSKQQSSRRSDNLSDHLVGETGGETVTMGETRHPDKTAWLCAPLALYLNLNLPSGPRRWTWGHDSACSFFPNVTTLNKTFHFFFPQYDLCSWSTEDRWQRLAVRAAGKL